MKNIALNDSGAIYRDAVGMEGALDVAADRQFLCADLALYLCPFGDHDGRGAYLSLDVTKNSQGPMADNLADDRKARTNRGGRFRLQRITITRQSLSHGAYPRLLSLAAPSRQSVQDACPEQRYKDDG